MHGHCHQQALVGMDADLELLGRMGLDAELADAGCCGTPTLHLAEVVRASGPVEVKKLLRTSTPGAQASTHQP